MGAPCHWDEADCVGGALLACGERVRGTSPVDGRFLWHVVRPSEHVSHSSGLACATLKALAKTGICGCLMAPLVSRTSALEDVSLCVSGSTGIELALGRRTCTSDLDVDVMVYGTHLDAAVASIDAACTDLIRSTALEQEVRKYLKKAGLRAGKRRNSRVYVKDDGGQIVGVDVPRFSHGRRLCHSFIHATRNDSIPGMVLHRVRVSVSGRGGDECVPILDVKTRMRDPVESVSTSLEHVPVKVPSIQAALSEVLKLLLRDYDNVDSSKDAKRKDQLILLLDAYITQERCRIACSGVSSEP